MTDSASRIILPHPLSYMVGVCIWGVIGVMTLIIAIGAGFAGMIMLALFCLALAIFVLVATWAKYKQATSCCWRLNTDMVEYNYAFFVKVINTFQYDRIDEVGLSQSFFGRIFGFGTISLTARGKDGSFRLRNIEHPDDLYEFFRQKAASNKEDRHQSVVD